MVHAKRQATSYYCDPNCAHAVPEDQYQCKNKIEVAGAGAKRYSWDPSANIRSIPARVGRRIASTVRSIPKAVLDAEVQLKNMRSPELQPGQSARYNPVTGLITGVSAPTPRMPWNFIRTDAQIDRLIQHYKIACDTRDPESRYEFVRGYAKSQSEEVREDILSKLERAMRADNEYESERLDALSFLERSMAGRR